MALDLSAMALGLGLDSHVLSFGELDVPDNPLPEKKCPYRPNTGSSTYSYAPALMPWLAENLNQYDGVVLHGMWVYPNRVVAARCVAQKIPYACFPHGMLEPWSFYKQGKFKTIKKQIYWHLFEKQTFEHANHILFTSTREMHQAARIWKSPKCGGTCRRLMAFSRLADPPTLPRRGANCS